MALFNEIESLPNEFPEDLKVLIVDHDTDVLDAIVEMCIPCNYHVSTCSKAAFALKLLTETKGFVDVILIEAQMPDMDSYDFVRHVTQQINIPVIMMCVDESRSAVMKAMANGACQYWIKPLIENQIKNLWQYAAKKVLKNENKHDQILGILKVNGQSKRGRDDNAPKETNDCLVEKDNNDNYQPLTKKNRLSWSSELHQQFLRVVNEIGLDNAKPKAILKEMNVPGLTNQQVASHLQRVKTLLKSSTQETLLKTRMSKDGQKKSNFDQYHVSNETQLSTEVVHSIQDPKVVMNSAIQCNNNSHAQQHMMAFDDYEVFDNIGNFFTGESNMILDDIDNIFTDESDMILHNIANIFTDQSNMILDDSSLLYEARPPLQHGIFN